ncbi:MAG: hypothetical protein U5L74_14515 [Ideonella sp.]|nr:hypothetical protein [Ideonella sp.]
MRWQRLAQFTGLGLLVGAMAWVAAQSQVTTPIGSYLELGGQVVAPANSPTLNSTLDLSGQDQVRWTSYFQSKLDGPQDTEGVLDIPPGHTWVAGSVRKPANASMQWLVNGQWASSEPAQGSAVTQVKWTLAPQSRLLNSQSSQTGSYLGRLGPAYRLIPYKDSMFVSMMGGIYGGSSNTGYLKCRLASSTYDPCVTRVEEMARGLTGLPGQYFISSGGYSFPDKEGELLQLADTGPKSRLWHASIVPLENVNQETGEMFMGMQKADGSGNYVVCLNLDTFRHCGQWRLSPSKDQIINLGSAGTKYFTMVDGSGTVVCFDTARRAECGRDTLPAPRPT